MQWFKMYGEAWHDPKLKMLTDAQFRVWFNLLCYASLQDERGSLKDEDEACLAKAIAEDDVNLLRSTIATLIQLKCMTATTCNVADVAPALQPVAVGQNTISLTFLNFGRRQGLSVANASTLRSRKFRERQKLQKLATHATPMQRSSNAVATRVQRSATEDKDLELEEKKPSLPSPHLQVASKAPVGVRADDSLPTRVEPKPEVRLEPPPRPVEPNRLPFPEDGGKVEPGKHDMPLAVAKELYDDLWDTYENPGLCRAFLRNRRAMPVEAWRWTFREVGRYCDENDQPPRSLKLFLKFAKDWEPGMKGGYDIDVKPADPPRPKYTPEQLKGFAECAENIRQLREASKLRMANLDPWKMAELGRGVATGEILMPLAKSMREFEPKSNPNY